MAEADLLAILSQQEDVLTPRASVVFGAANDCPRCGGALASKFDEKAGRLRHRCVSCGFARDAETGLVIDLGQPEKTRDIDVKMITPPGGSRDDRR